MSDWQEVKAETVSFGKVGDYIEGVLTDIRERDIQDDVKGVVRKKIYEIRGDEGEFHMMDDKRNPIEPGVRVMKGDFYTVWGGKEAIDNGMRKIKINQRVKILFAEEGEPKRKGYSGFKLMKVYAGGMDETEPEEDVKKEW